MVNYIYIFSSNIYVCARNVNKLTYIICWKHLYCLGDLNTIDATSMVYKSPINYSATGCTPPTLRSVLSLKLLLLQQSYATRTGCILKAHARPKNYEKLEFKLFMATVYTHQSLCVYKVKLKNMKEETTLKT
jgi:hypothetical protein